MFKACHQNSQNNHHVGLEISRSQLPSSLRHEPSSPARTLGAWVRIPLRGMNVRVRLFCVCVVLCAGSGLATG
jgi:hypothetical protein